MRSACQWDGTLSPNDFNSSVAALCGRWKEVNDSLPQWSWVPFPVVGNSSCNEVSHEESILGDEELSDEATLVQSCCKDDVHVYDYHIVYSFNFRVPVLYFRGYRLGMHFFQVMFVHDLFGILFTKWELTLCRWLPSEIGGH
ncbi:hypothetical protein BHE74_00023680 [Ensete ventricosum]|nr:hypothetical protein BHE74_00023680 [Ensete ventricosum]